MANQAAQVTTQTLKAMNSTKGFTLFELLIVLVLIGIGIMGVVPNIVNRTTASDKTLDFFEKVLKKAEQKAQSKHEPIQIAVIIGSDTVIDSGNKHLNIPYSSTVSEVFVNSQIQLGRKAIILVYPDGISDYFKITFSDGKSYESVPLLMRVKKYENTF